MKQQITKINIGRRLNSHSKIWRYLDFSRFVSLLETRTIHFSRVSAFEDKHDGIFNCLNEDDHYDITNNGKMIRTDAPPLDARGIENSDRFKQFMTLYHQAVLSAIGVSCWRLDDHESHAMWRVFLKSDQGVAIESTLEGLTDSVAPGKHHLVLGKVRYIDYSKKKIPITNLMNAFFYKNVYFEHEKELRLICYEADGVVPEPIALPNFKPLPSGGIDLPADLSLLIAGIHISPYSPAWFRGLVGDVIRRYGMEVPIHASAIELRRA